MGAAAATSSLQTDNQTTAAKVGAVCVHQVVQNHAGQGSTRAVHHTYHAPALFTACAHGPNKQWEFTCTSLIFSPAMWVLCLIGQCHCGHGGQFYLSLTPPPQQNTHKGHNDACSEAAFLHLVRCHHVLLQHSPPVDGAHNAQLSQRLGPRRQQPLLNPAQQHATPHKLSCRP